MSKDKVNNSRLIPEKYKEIYKNDVLGLKGELAQSTADLKEEVGKLSEEDVIFLRASLSASS